MIRQFFLWGTMVVAAAVSAAAPTDLRDIRLSADAAAASVTLDMADVVSQKLFTLSAPARVVIDLQHTRLSASVHVPKGDGIIAAVRTGPRAGGTLRVVIELKSAVAAHSRWLARADGPGQQLVINLGQMAVASVRNAPLQNAPPQPVQALHAPTETDRPIVVAVDAGHGGQDPGAIGHGGTREKDVTLAIARALAQRINSEPGMRAVLTRNRDEFLVLGDRIHRAHLARADLFVSVHADSIRDESVAGASVYVLSDRGATDEAARWLADRENSADLVGGLSLENKNPQLKSVLIDLSQSATISSSMVAAERVLAALDSVGEVRKSRVQQAGFVVLKSRDIASMLVETAYISNPQEERRLRTSAQQEKLAGAIFSGIRTFFETNPPPGIRLAQLRRGVARVAPIGPSLP
jgi:N-acetylmuramoyl-L-alanine amidase